MDSDQKTWKYLLIAVLIVGGIFSYLTYSGLTTDILNGRFFKGDVLPPGTALTANEKAFLGTLTCPGGLTLSTVTTVGGLEQKFLVALRSPVTPFDQTSLTAMREYLQEFYCLRTFLFGYGYGYSNTGVIPAFLNNAIAGASRTFRDENVALFLNQVDTTVNQHKAGANHDTPLKRSQAAEKLLNEAVKQL